MTSKHTQGSWHVEWGMADGGEAHHICDNTSMHDLSVIAVVKFHDDTKGETKANARLIAAAPDLLAALEAIFGDGTNPVFVTNGQEQFARAAIAKARGE